MESPDTAPYESDEAFWAEIERRHRELDENPSLALTHEEVMASVDEAIRSVSMAT
jgi:putative addiction module component (TIGR02574 family)